MPTVDDVPGGRSGTSQVTQPPLYYLTAAPVVALLDSGAPLNAGQNPLPLCIAGESANGLSRISIPTSEEGFPPQGAAAAGYGLRLLNLALGAAAVVFTFLAARVLFPARPAIALVGAALLAFEPSTLRMITNISNEALLLTLAAASLYFSARLIRSQPVQWRWGGALLLLAALSVFTRLNGWAILAFNLLVLLVFAGRLLLQVLQKRASQKQAWIAIGIVVALVIGVPIIATINLSTTGSVFGRYSFLDQRVSTALEQYDFSPTLLRLVLELTLANLAGTIGILVTRQSVINAYLMAPLIAMGGALLALVGAIIQWWRTRSTRTLAALLLLWAAFLIGVGLVYIRNVVDSQAYGGITEYNTAGILAPIRYYAPGLPACALLMALGALVLMDWLGALIGRISRTVGEGLRRLDWLPGAALAVAWAGVMLLGIVVAVRATPHVPTYSEEQARALPGITWLDETASETGFPRILGYSASPGEQAGMTDLTLYAALDGAGTSALGRILIDDGTALSACEFVPGRGTLPLTVWQPGVVYALDVSLPTCDAAAETLNLAAQWQAADATGLLTGDSSPPVTLGSVVAPGARARSCVSPLGRIAGYTVVKYNGPDTTKAGGLMLPSVNWIIEDVSPDFASRVYTFTHEESGQSFICSRMDGEVNQWTRGTYRYFDRCVFTFPEDAPLGEYRVSVALLDANGEPLPATGPDGEALADGQVPLGSLTLE